MAQRMRVDGDLGALEASLKRFDERPCAQVLYIGPYSNEGPTIARLHAFIRERGYSFEGSLQKHHENYLSDPRRRAPDWMTIIRQPFAEERAANAVIGLRSPGAPGLERLTLLDARALEAPGVRVRSDG